MPAVIAGIKRESLVEEIGNALRQWPELERTIFCKAHYHGESPESIARCLELDVEEVGAILRQCERRLHVSLRNFLKSSGEKPSPVRIVDICPSAWEQNLKGACALASKVSSILDDSRIAV